MKDKKYFDDKLYCFISKRMKKVGRRLSKSKYPGWAYIIDDALRLLFAKENKTAPVEPSRPDANLR